MNMDNRELYPTGTNDWARDTQTMTGVVGSRMHTQYPDSEANRFFTYRNRGYLMSQSGMA